MLPINLYFQPFGKRVGYGSAHAVQTARILIVPLPEFSARMQHGKNDLDCRKTCFSKTKTAACASP